MQQTSNTALVSVVPPFLGIGGRPPVCMEVALNSPPILMTTETWKCHVNHADPLPLLDAVKIHQPIAAQLCKSRGRGREGERKCDGMRKGPWVEVEGGVRAEVEAGGAGGVWL